MIVLLLQVHMSILGTTATPTTATTGTFVIAIDIIFLALRKNSNAMKSSAERRKIRSESSIT